MWKKLLDRPVAVSMVMLVVVVLGMVSIRLLPVSLIPEVEIPYISVQAVSPQMSACEMDEGVVRVLRQQLMQLGGLEDIRTESRDGVGDIRLSFSHGTNMDYSFVEVNEKVDRCMSSLPDIERPKVFKSSATDIPAFYINLTLKNHSEEAFNEMSFFARDVISKRLEQQPEVAMVDISGYVDEQIMVLPDEEKLSQMGMSISEFEYIVNSSNVRLGSLVIRDGQYRYSVKLLSNVGDIDDIRNIRFREGDRIYRLEDIAKVVEQPAKRSGLVRSDGKRAVSMAVIKQSDARMAALKSSMDKMMSYFAEDYPEIEFTVTRDQTSLLEYSINNLLQNIIVGVILACLVIFLFMRDFRSPALVCLTMPVALVFSMAVFYVVGLSINIISLSGLLLGVGMMADNTIILVDNITTRWQRGEGLREAVLDGSKEVAGPMLSSVLTTCAVFIPLIFVSGIAGELFYDQAMAIAIVLLTSYIVTLVVIPVYYYRWFRKQSEFRPNVFLNRFSIDDALRRWDEKLMSWFLDHRYVAWGILCMSAVGVFMCFSGMRKERLPELTQTEAILTIDWNSQISVEENEARIAALETLVKEDCQQINSFVGVQNFILGHSEDLAVSQSSVYFSCPDEKSLESVKNIFERHLSRSYPYSAFDFEESGNIFNFVFAEEEASLTARIRPASRPSLELEGLRGLLDRLRAALPDVRIGDIPVKTDAVFVADPELMALYGVSYTQLASILKTSLNENRIFSLVQGTRTIPVMIGTDAVNLAEILSETFVETASSSIPVSFLMRQSYAEDFKTIISGAEGNYYPLPMEADSRDVPSIMQTVRDVVAAEDDFELSFSGSWFTNRKMVSELVLVLLIALSLLFLILASQFESLLQPLIILSEVLIDIFASLAVLWIMGLSINLMSMIGLVVVSGIVINDSILKIDTINRMRASGYSLRNAVMEAGSRRMKAIIMTSLTTILAVLPFLSRGNMGDDLQYPMSVVIIVGMSVGTLVSLFVLPALYYSLYRKSERKNG